MNDFSHLIQRKRVGEIKYIEPSGKFGFIEAEDFREDVFFHMSTWEPERPDQQPYVKMVVEFEVDQAHRKETDKLRATVVRRTDRPFTQVLSGRKDPHLQVKHHPKARQRKPTWRKND